MPPEAGAGYSVTTPLEALDELGLLPDVTLVSGLAIPFSRSSLEPADVPAGGAFRDFHGGGAGPLLCGTRSQAANFTCST